MKDDTRHVPVLLEEVLAAFRANLRTATPRILDGTLGGAGHSEALLEEFPGASLVAFDRDESALGRARNRLARFGGRVTYVHENFRNAASFARKFGTFDGALLDLGISSDQLDDGERGFTFQGANALDMRMDQSQGETALEILNDSTHGELARIFDRGGLRKHASRLAEAIIDARPIRAANQVTAICETILASPRERRLKQERGGGAGAPAATVPFQALRIAVNDELGAIESFLEEAPSIVHEGSVLAIITFHSLEDEIVTRQFRAWARRKGATRSLPGEPALGRHLTQKPIVAGEAEASANSRARSARLRVFAFGDVE